MRSEKDQMTVGKEKSVVEIQFRDLQRDQENIPGNPKQKEEKKEVFTKVVIRRLPPNLSKDQLEEQLSPLPSYDYFEFFPADQSLYPHLFSRAYINFKNPEDILLFRDRFDGYVFIDNKGQEYPAVVEFAPFQKISKKKLKKKDAKAGSIEEDPEYRRFLENYSCDEEKSMANPETLLGEIEAKTRELIAKRTTPLLEYIKNKKIEKQRIREEKREERRRRELEKKRQREEEKRKRREEERRKRKEAEKQKKLSEKDIKIKLLKKSDRDDDVDSDRIKDKSDIGESDRGKWEKSGGQMKSKDLKEKGQPESDKEQREQHSRRQRDKDHRGKDEERKRQRHHYEFDKFMRRKDETKWGKGYCQDRAKKEGHHHGYSYCPDNGDKLGKEDRDDLGNRKERLRNKDRPAMQLYQPGARNRKRMSSAGKGYDCIPVSHSPEPGAEHCYDVVAMATGLEKGFEKRKDEQHSHAYLSSASSASAFKKVMRSHSHPVMTVNSSTSPIDNATLALFQSANVSLAISVIYMFITLFSLLGNGLSMWILIFRTSPKTPSIILMIHLTLTDLALGTALPFQIAYQLQGYHWNMGPSLCSVLTLVFYTNMYCSILTMMAIGIDRYLGIVRPMLFRQIRGRKAIAVLSCILMWAIVLSVLHPLMTTDLTFDIPELGITTCFDMLKRKMLPTKAAWAAFIFSMVVFLFFLPFCVTAFCYIRVIVKLASDCKTVQKKRAINLAVVVILVFTLCFAPNNILLFAHGVMRLFYGQSLYMYYKLTLCFSCINSCLDPFIYYFASKDFRQKLRRIMKLKSQSSADSMRTDRKDSMHSAHFTFDGHDKDLTKLSLVAQNSN